MKLYLCLLKIDFYKIDFRFVFELIRLNNFNSYIKNKGFIF